jgi:hypothetical protein
MKGTRHPRTYIHVAPDRFSISRWRLRILSNSSVCEDPTRSISRQVGRRHAPRTSYIAVFSEQSSQGSLTPRAATAIGEAASLPVGAERFAARRSGRTPTERSVTVGERGFPRSEIGILRRVSAILAIRNDPSTGTSTDAGR